MHVARELLNARQLNAHAQAWKKLIKRYAWLFFCLSLALMLAPVGETQADQDSIETAVRTEITVTAKAKKTKTSRFFQAVFACRGTSDWNNRMAKKGCTSVSGAGYNCGGNAGYQLRKGRRG